MMGPKKLSEIQQELKAALTEEVGNPIEWLEQRIRELEKRKKGKPASTEVFESLLRLFEKPRPNKRRKRGAAKTGR